MHIPMHDIEFEHDHILILEFILLITCAHIKSSNNKPILTLLTQITMPIH